MTSSNPDNDRRLAALTLEQLLVFQPCYGRERMEQLAKGRPTAHALEILAEEVPMEDRLATVVRPELLPPEVLLPLGCVLAEDVIPVFERFADGTPLRRALEAKRAWLNDRATSAEVEASREQVLAASRVAYFSQENRLQAASRSAYAVYLATEPSRDLHQVAAQTLRAAYAAAVAERVAENAEEAFVRVRERQGEIVRRCLNEWLAAR